MVIEPTIISLRPLGRGPLSRLSCFRSECCHTLTFERGEITIENKYSAFFHRKLFHLFRVSPIPGNSRWCSNDERRYRELCKYVISGPDPDRASFTSEILIGPISEPEPKLELEPASQKCKLLVTTSGGHLLEYLIRVKKIKCLQFTDKATKHR